MDFEWNEEKRQSNLKKHGVDIFDAALIFDDECLTVEDQRYDYGEIRLRSTGVVDGQCYVVIHTDRDGIIRLISAWKGGRRDRRDLETYLFGRNKGDEEQG
ncbi:BrnT family toxin [Devosia aurantiaca]|uniref:BrnT family toxin n=1 Tax=Devosia aurantiaca TaxID=2714858 RepID=A0A6M1SVF3_9HYPH|nr:BrnT family toxin [Devosia aurantiaca]NGP19372.1 BrnT family toxin [Devosia aurantiaca]